MKYKEFDGKPMTQLDEYGFMYLILLVKMALVRALADKVSLRAASNIKDSESESEDKEEYSQEDNQDYDEILDDDEGLLIQLENILCAVPSDFFDEHNFNPFKHWKEDPKYLENLKNNLEKAVEKIVELKYKGFNRSSACFSSILQKFMRSQSLLVQIQGNMQHSRRLLLGNTQQKNLSSLYYESLMHKKTLEIIDKIEFILSVPRQLDDFISRKQYLHAVHVLVGTLNLLSSPGVNALEGLGEIHDDLLLRRNVIQDLLIDELHVSIYKSQTPLQEDETIDRITSFRMKNHSFGPKTIDEESFRETTKPVLFTGTNFPAFLTTSYPENSAHSLFALEASFDYTENPEGSDIYLKILVESLDRLDRLPSAETSLCRRLKEELKKIVLTQSKNFKSNVEKKDKNQTISSLGFVSVSSEMLVELMEGVFSRFTDALRNHQEVIGLICFYMKKDILPHYTYEAIWTSMQSEISDMLIDYISVQKKQGKIAPSIKTNNLISTTKHQKLDFTFSFEESRSVSLSQLSRIKNEEKPDNSNLDAVDLVERAPLRLNCYWITPTPYNIVTLYRRIVQFIDQSQSMLGLTNQSSILRTFISDFILNVLMPRVHADAHVRVQDIMSSPAAFKQSNETKNERTGEEDRVDDNVASGLPILKCATEICEVIHQLFSDMFQLPSFVAQYVTVMQYVLSLFLEKCQEKFDEITKATFVSNQLQNPTVFSEMQSDPLYLYMRQEVKAPDYRQLDNFFQDRERHLYSSLFDGSITLERNQLILDSNRWSLLALLAQSLEWMNERIRFLADPNSTNSLPKEDVANSFKSPSNKRRNTESRGSVLTREKSKTPAVVAKRISSIFGPNQDFMAAHFTQLSDMCLFTLRMELSAHCFYFLSSIRSESYWLSEEPTTPEPFVLDLNTDLALAGEKLSDFLTSDKIKYLFGSMANLVSSIVISIMSRLRVLRVNRNGVSQICRNLFALQQNLTNIVVTQDGYFDHARQYWELLNLSEEELNFRYQDSKSKEQQRLPTLFTSSEIRVVFSITTQIRKSNIESKS